MTPRALKFIRFAAVACIALTGVYATAAQVTAQRHSGYQRLNFSFGQPAHLKIDNAGNTLVLHFDAPLNQPAAEIQTMLKGYATSATLSANGHDLTLNMNKAYRTRQFVSGNSVGVDLIGAPGEDVAQAEPAPAKTEAAPKKIVPLPPAPKKPEAKKSLPAAKVEPAKTKPEPVKPEVKPVAETAPVKAIPAEDPMLTTKPAVSPPTPIKPVTPAAEKPVPTKTKEPLLTTKPAVETKPEAPVVKSVPPEKPAPAPQKPAPKPEAKVEPKTPVKHIGFVVTAHTKGSTTTINFPYNDRTAAAVFERARDVWVVFSQAQNVNVSLLRTVLPKSVVDVTQYANPTNTILHFVTDGTIHASAQPIKDDYGWNLALAPSGEAPTLDVPISVDSTDDTNRLLLGVYDVAPPLSFYDPNVGDLLIVVPAYEAGRGVANSRHFPELDVLNSNQGVAVASARDDVRTTTTRIGVSLESPNGLAVSKNLFVQNVHAGLSSGGTSGIMLPYEQWYVEPKKFNEVLATRMTTLAAATKDTHSEALLSIATLYLGQGMGSEALGYLQNINAEDPEFYKNHKLALLTAAADVLENHFQQASEAIAAPELVDFKEADLWREYLALFVAKPDAVQQVVKDAEKPATTTPAAAAVPVVPAYNAREDEDENAPPAEAPPVPPSKPLMHFLKYNKTYIRFYPPRIRQRLVVAAADAYIDNGLEEKALAAFDTLNRDDILQPVRRHAEYALAMLAIKNKKPKDAELVFKRLEAQPDDPEIRARARFTNAMLQFAAGKKTAEETTDTLESIRTGWRGDGLEKKILKTLAQIAKDTKHYDEALRAYRTFTEEFPGDAEYITIAGEMGDLFEQLYFNGMADEMPPLKSLSLFYEFRDLTPIGDKGDAIIQKLADRLAAFDLIDRASQLLENQIAFRVSGQVRSQVGARLALLYLLNHQPKEALRVLEVTSYGVNPPELQRQRLELTAQALNESGRQDDALNVLYNDSSNAGELLKLDILWSAQDWPNMVNRAEDILSKRTDLTAKLTPTETEVLLKLALGYSFEGDYTQLRYLRDYYSSLLSDTAYKQIFDYITNDTTPLDREDTTMLAQQISRTESFMNTFKAKIAAGKLSEAIK